MISTISSKPPPAARHAPGLYVTATPIGNAGDISLRALSLLENADLVLCEDTRVTAKLLAIHQIRASLETYHEHNAAAVRPKILQRLKEGAVIALVSDAGTPLISDPGLKLVQAAIAQGVSVTTLPGPSAVLAGLTLSGLPSDRFFFAGFLPPKKAARRTALQELKIIPATLIFLESPKRLAAALADMHDILGDRAAAVARELTKKFEQVRRASLGVLAQQYAAEDAPKGEIVVLAGPPPKQIPLCEGELDALLENALRRQSLKDAVAEITAATGLPRREVYARALVVSEANAHALAISEANK